MPSFRHPAVVKSVLAVLAAGLAGGLAYAAWKAGWPRERVFMTGIFVLAAALWATEAIPLHATALLVLAAEVICLANPAGWPKLGFAEGDSPTFRAILGQVADPLLLLFLGGLILARACTDERVDQALGGLLLRPFAGRPGHFLLAVLGLTAGLSMWMSNTATAALMVAVVGPALARVGPDEPFRRAAYLAIPVGANLGGMATPVASPPNAIATALLADAGIRLGFLQWTLIALPCLLLLLTLAWVLLRAWYPASPGLQLDPGPAAPLTGRGYLVVGIFVVTVGLWLTDAWHGLPAAVVALFPTIALTATGLVGSDSLKRLDWPVLILIAGGLALGAGMQLTDLDRQFALWLEHFGDHPGLVSALLVVLALLLGAFMSSTAAANLLLPLVLAGSAGQARILPACLALCFALAACMPLPGSTPPNAIVHATGTVSTRDLARMGGVLALAAVLLGLFGVPFLVRWLGPAMNP